jgi:hypothetical protein
MTPTFVIMLAKVNIIAERPAADWYFGSNTKLVNSKQWKATNKMHPSLKISMMLLFLVSNG